jgi:hypothetical protein
MPKRIWIWALTFGGFIGWLIGILGFFGIDAKTMAKIMTAHYLFLLLTVISFAGFAWGIYLWWQSSRVTINNVEQKLKEWIDAFGLARRIVTNEKLDFGIQVSIPPRFIVTIGRPKDRPSYLTLVSSIRLSKEQRALFDKMSEEEKMSIYRAIRLECGRLKIGHHMHENLQVLSIHKLIPITPDLKEARILDSINEVQFSADVVMDTTDSLIKPRSQVPNKEASQPSPTS